MCHPQGSLDWYWASLGTTAPLWHTLLVPAFKGQPDSRGDVPSPQADSRRVKVVWRLDPPGCLQREFSHPSPSQPLHSPALFPLGCAGLSKYHWHSRCQGGDDSRSGSRRGWLMKHGLESRAEVWKVRLGWHGGRRLLTGSANGGGG